MEAIFYFVERSQTAVCVYGQFGEYLSLAHKISLLMGWVLFGVGMVYKSIVLAIALKGLLLMQFPVWILQVLVADLREDYWCRGQMIYAFPNMEIFYVWSLGWFFVAFYWSWGWPVSWFRWSLLLLWFGLPVGILVWIDHLRWWEALVSILLGVVGSSLFVYRFKEDICPILPDILSEPLIVWCGYKDIDRCLNQRQRERLEVLVEEKQKLEKWHGRHSGRCCGSCFGR